MQIVFFNYQELILQNFKAPFMKVKVEWKEITFTEELNKGVQNKLAISLNDCYVFGLFT